MPKLKKAFGDKPAPMTPMSKSKTTGASGVAQANKPQANSSAFTPVEKTHQKLTHTLNKVIRGKDKIPMESMAGTEFKKQFDKSTANVLNERRKGQGKKGK